MINPSYQNEIVLIGGGHTHVQVVKMLKMKGFLPKARITMISDASIAYYSGMLPGCLAGLYHPEEIEMELRPLARWAGIRFIRARVTGVDPNLQQVFFEDDRPPMSYDVLSINIGSISRGMDIPGVKSYATPTRPLSRLLKQVLEFETVTPVKNEPLRVTIAGGGAAGVELAFAVHARWVERFHPLEVTLIDSQDIILRGHHTRVQRITTRYMSDKGIRYISNERIERVDDHVLKLDSGQVIPFDLLLWATGGAPPPMINKSGLDTNEAGFIHVRPTLQTLRYDNIFAAGDCIHFEAHPLPKAGVYAVREGPVLAENLAAFISGDPLKPYKPQPAILALLMTGTANAIASWRFVGLHGPRIWRLKDWIDRKWMQKFDPAFYPPMKPPEPEAVDVSQPSQQTMRCAGCGAKVGSTILTGVLDGLSIPDHPDVIVGLRDGDDAAVLSLPSDRLLIQTIDGFRAFIDDLYLFGRISLIHAASDIFAMGGNPHSALIMVTLPYAEKHLVADDLRQLMTGISDEARRMNLTITGGHTCEGAEAAVGVMLNGLIDPEQIMKKDNLTPGDALILTKPLGTGVILAADMHLKSKGRWMDEVLDGMLQTNEQGAGVFKDHDISAVTDITGFGLAGHLVEMLDASGVSADLSMSKIPHYDGVGECLAKGVQSTLSPSNRSHLEKRRRLNSASSVDDDILFDPQTSGGLLAGVSQDKCDRVLDALHQAGYDQAACIGQVVKGDGVLNIS